MTLNTIPIGENSFLGLTVTYRESVNEIKPQQIPVFSNGIEGRGGKYRMAITYPIVNNNPGKYLGIVGMLIHIILFFCKLWQRYRNTQVERTTYNNNGSDLKILYQITITIQP